MGRLYILATPIGNLEDITLRGLRVLREADVILAEDTRVTRKLLDHFEIKKPLWIFHHHSLPKDIGRVVEALRNDQQLVLVTDAGTPGISDPGGKLVEEVVRQLGEKTEIIPLPGANAAMAALSISGFPADKFLFLGFPPHQKGRNKFFQEIVSFERTVVFYESPHRIIKCLELMASIPKLKDRPLVIGRELTKKFETIYRGKAGEILEGHREELSRGELTIVVGK